MNLLSRQEINEIISILDKTTSIFKECRFFDDKPGESKLLNMDLVSMHYSSLTDIINANIETPKGTPRVFLKIWLQFNELDSTYLRYRDREIRTIYSNKTDSTISFQETASALEYEAVIYQYITDNIILRDVSPNFVPILLNHACGIDSIIDSIRSSGISSPDLEKLYDKLTSVKKMIDRGNLSMRFIMTGSAPNVMTAYEFWNHVNYLTVLNVDSIFKLNRLNEHSTRLSREEIKIIIFQFFYIFYVLHKYKISHHDFHFDNSLVQVLDNPALFEININGRIVRYKTRYVVKIFDWDRAYREGEIARNELLTTGGFSVFRLIAKFIPNKDFFSFLCLLRSFKIDGLHEILAEIVDGYYQINKNNDDTYIIKDVLSDDFKQWIISDHERLLSRYTDANGNVTDVFLTISKEELEAHIPNIEPVRTAVNNKLESLNGYDNISTFYFKLGFNDLIIIKGNGCHTLFDHKNINIAQYFETDEWFAKITNQINQHAGEIPTYKYEFKNPIV